MAEKIETIEGSGGLKLVPDYTFGNAPAARGGAGAARFAGLARMAEERSVERRTSRCLSAPVRFSADAPVCSTARYDYAPRVLRALRTGVSSTRVRREARFVENEGIATAAGRSSGIDLALRVVERYFGRAVAQRTAAHMEYQGIGWVT